MINWISYWRFANLFTAVFILLLASCQHTENENATTYTSLVCVTPRKAIGVVHKEDTVQFAFYVTNAGRIPLLIDAINASCACTVPEYEKRPVVPGDSAKIVVRFIPTPTFTGTFEKKIVLLANTKPAFTILSFYGTVEPTF